MNRACDPALRPFLTVLMEILEERSQLISHDRRHAEDSNGAPAWITTQLALSNPALIQQVKERLLCTQVCCTARQGRNQSDPAAANAAFSLAFWLAHWNYADQVGRSRPAAAHLQR